MSWAKISGESTIPFSFCQRDPLAGNIPEVIEVLQVFIKSGDASMSKTLTPSCAALMAPTNPPPAPATTKSYLSTAIPPVNC